MAKTRHTAKKINRKIDKKDKMTIIKKTKQISLPPLYRQNQCSCSHVQDNHYDNSKALKYWEYLFNFPSSWQRLPQLKFLLRFFKFHIAGAQARPIMRPRMQTIATSTSALLPSVMSDSEEECFGGFLKSFPKKIIHC